MNHELPLPPPEMRLLVGPTEDSAYQNESGESVFPELPATAFASVFDLGCGCGRLARRLALQRPRPNLYVGVDLHAGMIRWCRRELASRLPGFEFHHLDLRNPGLNPGGELEVAELPAPSASVSLFLAWSVFTHMTERVAEFYLREMARLLRPDGVAITTWFLFDKAGFPMMQDFQNALFINDTDPTNAVIFDRAWLTQRVGDLGLRLASIRAPQVRGYQWLIRIERDRERRGSVPFPPDDAAVRAIPSPLLPANAVEIGHEPDEGSRS